MSRILERLAVAAFALLILFAWFGCVRWEYRECKQVGHGTLYCMTHMGKGNRR